MPVEQTFQLTAARCDFTIGKLNDAMDLLRLAKRRDLEGTEVWVYREPSLIIALDRLESFTAELKKSLEQIQLGDPFHADSSKNRTVVRAKNKRVNAKPPAKPVVPVKKKRK